jgi:ribonuclease-3
MLEPHEREALEKAIGYRFTDPELLELSLTHASTSENRAASNERMEFLGDSVLGLVTVDLTFRRFPDLLEGDMTKIKSHAVSRETCAILAKRLGLDEYLILGKGMQNSGPLPPSLAAAALEAIIGAIYLDGGFDAAAAFVRPLISDVIDEAAQSGHQHNFKSVLQQYAQQHIGHTPTYRILDEQGPDHAKCFKICVEIAGKRYEPAWGQTKKKAEQDAALQALRDLGVIREGPGGRIIIPDDVEGGE